MNLINILQEHVYTTKQIDSHSNISMSIILLRLLDSYTLEESYIWGTFTLITNITTVVKKRCVTTKPSDYMCGAAQI
jgi:hypothetical protein